MEAVIGYYRSLLNIFDARGRYSLYILVSNEVEYLAARTVPTLALNGTSDGCVDARVFRRCCKEVVTLHGTGVTQHIEVPDAGHWLHLEKPDEVARHCIDFVERTLEHRAQRDAAAAEKQQKAAAAAAATAATVAAAGDEPGSMAAALQAALS